MNEKNKIHTNPTQFITALRAERQAFGAKPARMFLTEFGSLSQKGLAQKSLPPEGSGTFTPPVHSQATVPVASLKEIAAFPDTRWLQQSAQIEAVDKSPYFCFDPFYCQNRWR